MKEILTTLVQVVVIPAIPVLVTYLVKYLKAKALTRKRSRRHLIQQRI